MSELSPLFCGERRSVPATHIDELLKRDPVYETSPITGEKCQVYPCRCGTTHRGDYGIYDWGHRNCLHQHELVWLLDPKEDPALNDLQVMCPGCGNVWDIEPQTKSEASAEAVVETVSSGQHRRIVNYCFVVVIVSAFIFDAFPAHHWIGGGLAIVAGVVAAVTTFRARGNKVPSE